MREPNASNAERSESNFDNQINKQEIVKNGEKSVQTSLA